MRKHNHLQAIANYHFLPQCPHPDTNHDFHKIKVSAGNTDKKIE